MKFTSHEYNLLKIIIAKVLEQNSAFANNESKTKVLKDLYERLELEKIVMGVYLHELNMQIRIYVSQNELADDLKTQLENLSAKMKRKSHATR
ncbi:hypothetical protein MG290_07645 [Flavobacterium sp. CBA20B-1]|uniref:hypothetical protein n=1 Tax=unclassified Flavobacterium TaxID=196869 RepID=UPI002224AF7D|nr:MULTISPECIES: hypothetical protein [unclassified Flavobacterium]WCM40851.1 hypothetical protein MG290_07645 [Flavobacterium sp. CBA20B-1]